MHKYNHVEQNGPDWQWLRQMFPSYRGLCWLACLQMAIDALYDSELGTDDILRRLLNITIKTKADDVCEIIHKLQCRGENVQAFFDEKCFSFIDLQTGGADVFGFILRHPKEFDLLLNYLLASVNLEIVFCTEDIRGLSGEAVSNKLASWIADGWVAIVGETIVENSSGKAINGHVVFVPDVIVDESGDEFVYADPMFDKSTTIRTDVFAYYVDNGLRFENITVNAHGTIFLLKRA